MWPSSRARRKRPAAGAPSNRQPQRRGQAPEAGGLAREAKRGMAATSEYRDGQGGGGGQGAALPPFLVTPASAFGVPVCRLGLASYSTSTITADDVQDAIGRGVNFLNWAGLAEGPSEGDAFTRSVGRLGAGRQSVVVCAQFGARGAADA